MSDNYEYVSTEVKYEEIPVVESKDTVKPEKRSMTIARGLTRIKVIEAQISNLSEDIRKYGAWNNKTLCPISSEKDVKKNQQDAAVKVKAAFQSFQDLCKELTAIKIAIQEANLRNKITIAGHQLTIAEALVIRSNTIHKYDHMVNCARVSISIAESSVATYNAGVNKLEDAATKIAYLADVAYLAKKEDLDALISFATEFAVEIDGTLNEVNATTLIYI